MQRSWPACKANDANVKYFHQSSVGDQMSVEEEVPDSLTHSPIHPPHSLTLQ
jgi:hypothetical protein